MALDTGHAQHNGQVYDTDGYQVVRQSNFGGKTLGFASVSTASSGATAIVAAQGANQRIYVVHYQLAAIAGAVNVKWQSAANDITGVMPLVAASATTAGRLEAGADINMPVLRTNANEALNINLSAAIQVSGHITYWVGT